MPSPIVAGPGSLVGLILGRYRLNRLVGEGGMGAVYEATHQDLGRLAAIKTLHRRLADSEQARARFLREGQAASRIRHPNVADVYDVGIEEDCPYLVMEFLEGETLARHIAREGPLSVQRTADILVPVISAVCAAHELGVVHRDLKPDNIFLAAQRGGVQPKVLDFGISKILNRDDASVLTDTGAFLGTPYYVSPEQARGSSAVDARSDQYSLGVVLFECVTSRRPIEGASPLAIIHRIVHGDFVPPRQLVPGLPAAVEDLILRAMGRDPKDRFATTGDLGRALIGFASDGVRSSYTAEFSNRPSSSPAPTPPLDEAPTALGPNLGTTLGESAVQRDVPRATGTKWRWVGGALLASGVGAIAVSFGLAHRASDVKERSGQGEATSVAVPAGQVAMGSASLAFPASTHEPPVGREPQASAALPPPIDPNPISSAAPSATGPKPRSPSRAGAAAATPRSAAKPVISPTRAPGSGAPESPNRFLDQRTF